ncbi:MAG: CDP-alcohol phosphatidyltransferase family protein, partial [Planctomycetota bacterium]
GKRSGRGKRAGAGGTPDGPPRLAADDGASRGADDSASVVADDHGAGPDHAPPQSTRALDRSPRGHRRMPSWTVLPTLCTLGNLVAGFAAIFYATRSDGQWSGPWGWSGLTLAGALVFLGMALDAVDGALARLTRAVSEIGGALDSLADIVTFVVAPAFMTLMLVREYLQADAGVVVLGPEADTVLGKVIWGAAAVYVCCGALRLARFTIETGSAVTEEKSFHGLPSPGAAGGLVSLVILHQHLLSGRVVGEVTPAFAKTAALGIPFVMLLCGIAMVSSIPYVHFANRFIHGSRSFGYIARVVVAVLLVIWWFQAAVAIFFTAYVLSGPIALLWQRRGRSGRPDSQPPVAESND